MTHFVEGWRSFPLDVDVSDHEFFFVGYRQVQLDGPAIGVDTDPPYYGGSRRYNSYLRSWEVFQNADLGMEILIEYKGPGNEIRTTTLKPVVAR